MSAQTETVRSPMTKYIVLAALVIVAFFASYRLAVAGNEPTLADYANDPYGTSTPAVYDDTAAGGAGGAGGCSCCGDTGSGETIEGAATVDADGVQRISVDASAGYNPNVIVLQAGVPTEITFSEGYGCMAQVMSRELDFFEDLQSGPKTVALGPLEAGTYGFSCGMEMVFGQIVVE